MSILTLGSKKKRRKFPIKEWEKAKEKKKIPNQRVGESKRKEGNSQSKSGRKQKKRKKIPNQRMGERKRKKKERKILDQGSEENKRNIQKGLWVIQYLINTEFSPRKQEKKEPTT